MKLNSRAYPRSRKDREFLDKKHDGLHARSRTIWARGPSSFTRPFFVVWRTVHGEEKAGVVADLRPINRAAVPDCSPLPLQSDVIGSIRGNGSLTIIHATSFFFQFPVYPDHRDRFTIVGHRGLETSTVALMCFRNSPAYVQRFMDELLWPHQTYCRSFIDDIIVYSGTFEEHRSHLDTIFSTFTERGMSLSSDILLGFYVD